MTDNLDIQHLRELLATKDAEIEREREVTAGVQRALLSAAQQCDELEGLYTDALIEIVTLRRVRARLRMTGHEATCAAAMALMAAITTADADLEPRDCTCGWEARYQEALAESHSGGEK